jgi:O-antigen ligase
MLARYSAVITKKKQTVIEWEFFLFGLTLPMSIKLNHLSVLLILLTWLLTLKTITWRSLNWQKPIFLFSILYFLLEVLSLLYSENVKVGLWIIEKHVALVVLPICFSLLIDSNISRVYKQFSIGFVAGNFIIFCIFIFNYLNKAEYLTQRLSDSSILDISPLHPTYLSLFFITSILFLRHFFKDSAWHRLGIVFLILSFCVGIILSGSKIGVLYLVIVVIYFSYLAFLSFNKIKTVIVITALVGFLVFVGYKSQLVVHRFQNIMSLSFERHPITGYNTLSGRLFFWDCAISIIKKDPVLGVGIGDAQEKLDACYLQKEPDTVTPEFFDKYNAHNQFLQTFMEMGLIGLFILLYGFLYLIKESTKLPSKELLIILLFFGIYCFFESALTRNKGVIFFTFLLSFLHYWSPKQERNGELKR